jgi:hypothetical protein
MRFRASLRWGFGFGVLSTIFWVHTSFAQITLRELFVPPGPVRGLAIQGSTVMVGSPSQPSSVSSSTQDGAAFVYNATTGAQLREIESPTTFQTSDFGVSAALSGNNAFIGADRTEFSGAAYMFNLTTGQRLFDLLPTNNISANAGFGASVALSGNSALVGAPNNSLNSDLQGGAYLYNATTGAQTATLTINTSVLRPEFGNAVAMDGSTAVIGADGGFTTSLGDAYLFDVNTASQRAHLTASDLVTGSHFGSGVAISGNTVLVGTDNTLGGKGAAYVFDAQSGSLLRELVATDGFTGDQFGESVALSGNIALVGAPGGQADSFAGAVYIFNVLTGVELGKLVAPDSARNLEFGYQLSLDGSTAVIGTGEAGQAYIAYNIPEPSSTMMLLAVSCLALRRRRSNKMPA